MQQIVGFICDALHLSRRGCGVEGFAGRVGMEIQAYDKVGIEQTSNPKVRFLGFCFT